MLLRNIALLALVASSATIELSAAAEVKGGERRSLRKGWQVGTNAETEDEEESNKVERKLPKKKKGKSSDDHSGSSDVVGRADKKQTGSYNPPAINNNWSSNNNFAAANPPVINNTPTPQQQGGGGKDKKKGGKKKGGGGGGMYAGTFQYPDYSNSVATAAWNPKGVVISNSNTNYASNGSAGSPNLISTTTVQNENGMQYNVNKYQTGTAPAPVQPSGGQTNMVVGPANGGSTIISTSLNRGSGNLAVASSNTFSPVDGCTATSGCECCTFNWGCKSLSELKGTIMENNPNICM
mmetsp:Transcript_21016/g.45819  ORF Transcript_21016/g.45819 Transcript_21016/m.45819 type:complete len:295 (-) Transcript_21016:182-1066(-)|eukprot:CAMPEP_0178513452 /NCGR_PEP_ID=MMETSP0696-20121128/23485_1 /TAXON_ID=265572 /ORGANISM="Extubocellulus spinifer, Strain CCMP396" /LENGTH=294 /DNA_ID=CAMNT_0020143457 /DNA_START=120 /DNA_END=1004 /DNA_ORIENTATION=-